MTKKDALTFFPIGRTLEVVGHWRGAKAQILGEVRTVSRVTKDNIELLRPDGFPTDLDYRDAVAEEADGHLTVYWGLDQFIQYRIVEG
jgi:hypothetical protein